MATPRKSLGRHGDLLLDALRKVDRPGVVCTSRDLPVTMPGLEVDGVGAIRLPLGKTQARQLIKQCSQAPFGKGTATVVDTDVRRVWELDPAQFRLTNPKWEELISSIVGEVQLAFGLEQNRLQAHLYKLLLYETGSFFLPHQDGEKLPGMAATLVVGLPSAHAGGELVIVHEGKRYEIALAGAASGHELSYAAFYADCRHEILPVRDGYRLCLAYNVTLAKAEAKQKIAAPRTAAVVKSIGQLLRDWPWNGDAPKAAIALAHQYTQAGLRIDALKGIDRTRAEVLFDAAEQAGCVAHLALMTHWQSGSAEGGDDYYSSRHGRRRHWSYDDDEDEEAERGSGYEMGDVFDESLTLNQWSDHEGAKISLGELPLLEEEIVSDQSLDGWELAREEFEGFTGNAGMTLDRWYHRAAIVLWPKERHFAVLCEAGTDASIVGLEALLKRGKRARKAAQPRLRQEHLEFAAAIIESWSPSQRRYGAAGELELVNRSTFPRLLQELDDPELMRRFLAQVLPQDTVIQVDKSFLAFCRKHGWRSFQACLSAVVDESTATTVQRNAALVELLCLKRDQDADRRELCRRLTDCLVRVIEKIDAVEPKQAWQVDAVDRSALLRSLVKSLLSIEAGETLTRWIAHTTSLEKKYDLTTVHLATLFALEPWLSRQLDRPDDAVGGWLAHCRTELERRTARPPVRPTDFRRAAKLSCDCGDCRQLSRFLDDPHESVRRFPMATDRREHLHQIIDRNGCDLTHVTERVGRPYTLVCTKTVASYDAACQTYLRDLEHLQRLRAIEDKIT